MSTLYVIAFLLIAASSAAEPARQETAILGDWCAGSDGAFHEEFSLSIESGVRIFESWLHQRPAESGTWELKDHTFTVHGRSGEEYVYTIVSLTPKRLVLRQGEAEPEIYVRQNCRTFEPPPKD